MTFYEAAVEVLRRSGRPLHYKKITEIAVREDLLSHVGKTPDKTMSDRLEKEMQKNETSALARERPGVFKLDDEHAEEVTERIKQKHKEELESKRKRQSKSQTGQSGGDDGPKRRRSRGSKDEASPRKRQKDDSDTPERKKRKRTRDDGDGGDSGGGDDSSKRRRTRRSRDSASDAADVDLDVDDQAHLQTGPVRLEGIPLAAYRVLSDYGNPLEIGELADRIFDQQGVKFHTHEPVATVQSALANDNQIRQEYGHRPLFEKIGSEWRLREWDLDADVLEREQAALALSEQIRRAAVSQLSRELRGLQAEAVEHVALTLLERLGYRNIKVSKRSSEGDVFFTADWRQGVSEVRVCVRVVTDHDRELNQSAVDDLRETLDHYSASEGLIIHLGDISEGAVQKARVDGEPPITLFDRETFVELLVDNGIGVNAHRAPILTVDPDFIDALVD